MKVINVFGAPGTGKSTFASGLFSFMKKKGYSVEYVDEFAKRAVYQDDQKALSCQPYILGQQTYKLHILEGEVDYAINDSPLMLSSIYNQTYPESFDYACIDIQEMFDNINLLLTLDQSKTFDPKGRIHSQSQSVTIHDDIELMLNDYCIKYNTIDQYITPYQTIIDKYIDPA